MYRHVWGVVEYFWPRNIRDIDTSAMSIFSKSDLSMLQSFPVDFWKSDLIDSMYRAAYFR